MAHAIVRVFLVHLFPWGRTLGDAIWSAPDGAAVNVQAHVFVAHTSKEETAESCGCFNRALRLASLASPCMHVPAAQPSSVLCSQYLRCFRGAEWCMAVIGVSFPGEK